MNKAYIIGRLVRDPELRTTRDQIPVCTFTVAVDRRKGGAKADKQEADFFRVTAWRALGEICDKFLAKGRQVAVVGPVSATAYTTQSGETRAQLELTADDVEFLSPKSDSAPAEKRDEQSGFVQVDDEKLPWE